MQVISRFFILFLVVLFTGCSSSLSNYSPTKTGLVLGQNTPLKYDNPILTYHSTFNCVRNSYTIEEMNNSYGKLFVEYIDLYNECSWTGLATSHLETNIRYEANIDSLEVVENLDFGNYNFKTYKINNDSYLSLIYIFRGSEYRFILDFNGRLYTKLIKTFDKNYQDKFSSKKRFDGEYKDSLVRKNIINHYFSREVEIEIPTR